MSQEALKSQELILLLVPVQLMLRARDRRMSCSSQGSHLENDEAAYVIGADLSQAQRSLLGRWLDSDIKSSDQLSWQICVHIAHLHHLPLSAYAAWLAKVSLEGAGAATPWLPALLLMQEGEITVCTSWNEAMG